MDFGQLIGGGVNWWHTISWAEFSVGAVAAAIVTGTFGMWAHRYNKKAALEALDKKHQHEIGENDKAHQRELEKLRVQAADAEKAKFVELLRSFLKEAYRFHELNNETFSAALDLYNLVQKYGADPDGNLLIDPSDDVQRNDRARHILCAEIMRAGSPKLATAHNELSVIINEISAHDSDWGTLARDTRSSICEVNYPTSDEPRASFSAPQKGQAAIAGFQVQLDQYKEAPIN